MRALLTNGLYTQLLLLCTQGSIEYIIYVYTARRHQCVLHTAMFLSLTSELRIHQTLSCQTNTEYIYTHTYTHTHTPGHVLASTLLHPPLH